MKPIDIIAGVALLALYGLSITHGIALFGDMPNVQVQLTALMLCGGLFLAGISAAMVILSDNTHDRIIAATSTTLILFFGSIVLITAIPVGNAQHLAIEAVTITFACSFVAILLTDCLVPDNKTTLINA